MYTQLAKSPRIVVVLGKPFEKLIIMIMLVLKERYISIRISTIYKGSWILGICMKVGSDRREE